MVLCHEDASSSALSDCGPGYSYKDVSIRGIHSDAIPGLQQIAKRFAKECGVPCWNLGVNAVFLTSGRDKVGWHSDKQGEVVVGCIILTTTDDPRPLNIKEKLKKGIASRFESLSLKLGVGAYYVINGPMQHAYVHQVPHKNCLKPPSLVDARLSLVFCYGSTMNVQDNSNPVTMQLRFDQVQNHTPVRHGAIPGVEELCRYPLTFLQSSGAHRIGIKGVNGNMKDGCDAIIVSNNNQGIGEADGESTIFFVLFQLVDITS